MRKPCSHNDAQKALPENCEERDNFLRHRQRNDPLGKSLHL